MEQTIKQEFNFNCKKNWPHSNRRAKKALILYMHRTKIAMMSVKQSSSIGITPSNHDVVWGIGDRFDNHLANQHLKQLVVRILPKYAESSKIEKTIIIVSIIDYFRNRSNTAEGGFLKHDSVTDRFNTVNDHYAVSIDMTLYISFAVVQFLT